jgi:hypothetical protein
VNLDAYWYSVWQWCYRVQGGVNNGIIFRALICKWTCHMAINDVDFWLISPPKKWLPLRHHTSIWIFFNGMWKLIKQQMVHFKIPFWSICTIIPSLTCFLTKILRPIMPKFYHAWALGWVLVRNWTNLPNLLMIFLNFFYITLDVAWINTSFNCKPPLMCMHTSNWP